MGLGGRRESKPHANSHRTDRNERSVTDVQPLLGVDTVVGVTREQALLHKAPRRRSWRATSVGWRARGAKQGTDGPAGTSQGGF